MQAVTSRFWGLSTLSLRRATSAQTDGCVAGVFPGRQEGCLNVTLTVECAYAPKSL